MMIFRVLISSSLTALAIASSAAEAQTSTENYSYDALGRLVEAETVGGQNNNENHSICYDATGNRTQYRSSSDGSSAACVDQGAGSGGGGTPPPPPPPPPPGNNPPVTVNDSVSGQCFLTMTVNLTANDTDPESNYPLSLVSVSSGSGFGGAYIVSASSVSVDFGPTGDVSSVTYTVQDSLGATSTGQLTIATSSCSGGEMEP